MAPTGSTRNANTRQRLFLFHRLHCWKGDQPQKIFFSFHPFAWASANDGKLVDRRECQFRAYLVVRTRRDTQLHGRPGCFRSRVGTDKSSLNPISFMQPYASDWCSAREPVARRKRREKSERQLNLRSSWNGQCASPQLSVEPSREEHAESSSFVRPYTDSVRSRVPV